jgi:hypothetical protein
MIARFHIPAAAAAALVALFAQSAHADETGARCAEAFEKAQTDRASGKYTSAIAEAMACSQLECNTAVTRECIKLHETLKGEIPTLVFSARNDAGSEIVAVKVFVDGQPLLESIDGKPISLDPGLHNFRFETAGFPAIETAHTARVGDKNRLIEVVFERPGAKQVEKKPDVAPRPGPRKVPLASYILGGVGVAAIGAGVYMRVSGISDYNDMNSTCSPGARNNPNLGCDEDEVEAVRTKFLLSWVPIGVGSAAIVGAVVIYFVQSGQSSGAGAALSVVPAADGLRAQFRAHF